MLIQVIQGKPNDVAKLREAFDRWYEELAPGAHGWLGCTSGMTEDGTFFALERFESAEAAQRNSDRPEQGEWWAETSKLFDGEVTFYDCADALLFKDGGSDDAGFVQVIRGRLVDVDEIRSFMHDNETTMSRFRPDLMGGVVALHRDGAFTQAIYFTSEEEAREGERKKVPPEMQARLDEESSFYEGDITFFDLREPWLYSP